jgi:nicotinamidase-related amidase
VYRPRRKTNHEWILIDVATQRDFLTTNAPVPVRDRAEVAPRIRTLMTWVRAKRMSVISCMQAYRPADDFNGRPRHCVDGTSGQQKMPYTLLPKRIMVEADDSFTVPVDLLKQCRQVIFRKRGDDLLANPKAERLMNELNPDRFVIFGVGLERWIKLLALGLMVRKKRVTVVGDACGHWDPVAADLTLRQLEAKGIRIVKTDDLIVPEPITRTRQTRPIIRELHRVRNAG